MPKLWRGLLGLAVLAGLGALAWRGWKAYRVRQVPRVILLTPAVEGIDPARALGLERLVIDQMEVASAATVLVPEQTPTEVELQALHPNDLLLRVSGRRVGDALALRLEWITREDQSEGRAWRNRETPLEPPGAVFRDLAVHGPLPRLLPGADHLLPEDPARFWTLAAAESVQDDVPAEADLASSRSLAVDEPRSAAAWVNLGEHIYRDLWTSPADEGMPQSEALAAFDRALDLIPGYPRAALLKGMLLTDLGNQRSALRTLAAARALRPEIPDLYGGLAYAGRTSGLLEGASAAVAARERLSAPFRLSVAWFAENTYLYSGRWEEFRSSLGPRKDPVFIFYRAYLELAAGRKPEALALFQQGADIHSTSVPFGELCAVYAAALSGDADGALARLKRFEAARGRLRIPDGELTFKVAEAYAFLGRGEDAIAVAGRAFAQGFGCLAWYERSPLFAAARKSPRWPTLREHLRERRELMKEAFPPGTFG